MTETRCLRHMLEEQTRASHRLIESLYRCHLASICCSGGCITPQHISTSAASIFRSYGTMPAVSLCTMHIGMQCDADLWRLLEAPHMGCIMASWAGGRDSGGGMLNDQYNRPLLVSLKTKAHCIGSWPPVLILSRRENPLRC